jgi:hypothetical protein
MKLLRGILLVAGLTVAACQSSKPTTTAAELPGFLAQPQAIAVAGPYRHAASKFIFPVEVGDLHRTTVTQYDQDALNVSANYTMATPKPRALATVYVYPAPWLMSGLVPPSKMPSLSAIDQSRLCQGEFENAVRAIMTLHPSARLGNGSGQTIGSGQDVVSKVVSDIEYDGDFEGRVIPLHSRLVVLCFGTSGWIVKYRLTAPADTDIDMIGTTLHQGIFQAYRQANGI